jgi:hypothetical protein
MSRIKNKIEFLNRLKRILNEDVNIKSSEKLLKYSLRDVVNLLKDYENKKPDKKIKGLIDLLNKGDKDGSLSDDKIDVTEFYIKAKDLRPTQSEIDLLKSIGFLLTSRAKGSGVNVKESLKNTLIDGKAKQFSENRILLANEKYIIDGHHRWSQVFILNPDVEIPVINFDFKTQKIEDILKYFQIATFATFKNIVTKSTGEKTNIFELSRSEIEKILDKVLSDISDDALEVFKEFFKIENEKELKNKTFLYLEKNVLLFKDIYDDKVSKLPSRTLMPQPTDSAKEKGIKEKDATNMLKDKLTSGKVDLNDPFFKNKSK